MLPRCQLLADVHENVTRSTRGIKYTICIENRVKSTASGNCFKVP